MCGKKSIVSLAMVVFSFVFACGPIWAQQGPSKVYVPYENLKDVINNEKQGVFVPYNDFQSLWRAALGRPAAVKDAPVPFLISKAFFTGKTDTELAGMKMELTIDVLEDGWVQIPIGMGEVAVSKVSFKSFEDKQPCLLRIVNGSYVLLTKGKGRRVLDVDFVCQMKLRPGECVLGFKLPSAAITTLELLIPEQNMKVDVQPMLAATTSQISQDGKNFTKLQAFLGSAKAVKLTWKPSTQVAADLAPVVICNQLQTIGVQEALINYDVRFNYDIRRRGVKDFTIQLPNDFRVISVDGNNIARWDLEKAKSNQLLKVQLFSPAKDKYSLNVKMERFLKETKVDLNLTPIVTHNVLRRTGLIALSHSPRRSVELLSPKNLARVDVGQLPKQYQNGAVAYRFVSSDYSGKLAVDTVEPRISITQECFVGVRDDSLDLLNVMKYDVERVGVFQLLMNLPEPWDVKSVRSTRPGNLVEDYEFIGKGKNRKLKILLRQERVGGFTVQLHAIRKRTRTDADVDFKLPLPDSKYLRNFSGVVAFYFADHFKVEILKTPQLGSSTLRKVPSRTMPGLTPRMAFEFSNLDFSKPVGAQFRISIKPTQIFAAAHRLVAISAGAVTNETLIDYNISYAPISTVYLKMPAQLANADVQIIGDNIKESPRIDALPVDQLPAKPATQPADNVKWAYYKVVLQSPMRGRYRLRVRLRKQISTSGRGSKISVAPVLAAGKLAGQSGNIAIAVEKLSSLAVVNPITEGLTPIDPGSAVDIPVGAHRNNAVLAYRYSSCPADGSVPFELSFTVIRQKEAAVVTTQATGCIVEQALGRDGTLNSKVTYLLLTRRGDRLPITLPKGAKLFGVLLNGSEAPVESGESPEVRIVRLPPSAGQADKVVIEVSYSLANVKASNLPIPTLPGDVPVQQTLWRISLPDEDVVLGYDRNFAELESYQADNMIYRLSSGYPASVGFTLPAEGQQLDFIRQGYAAALSVTAMRQEWLACIVWAIVVIIGVVMLKFSGFTRVVIILVAALAMAVVSLFRPLLVWQTIEIGYFAGGLVLLLWIGQWFFKRKKVKVSPPAPKPAEVPSPNPEAGHGEPQGDDTEREE